ncbi:DUF4145 domain-containing protein [Undibacterium sp. TJN19]|uniref:DUF4145 domain-containing protein n=1 Tax=Undibacterium sp. TJN19 TaxID=3413055 RepID=UPI003BF2EB24
MSFDRTLWGNLIRRASIPKFRCPSCKNGHLSGVIKSNNIVEPTYSKTAGKDTDWEPDWTTERFVGFLQCDIPVCGEFVAISGDTATIEDFDEEFGWAFLSVLRPRSFFPSPPIINIAEQVPESVAEQLRYSFQLYWMDLNACANRLRVSVELLLDHFKISTTATGKSGKINHLDLNGRIALFEKQDPEHSKTLTALRMIGNLGSHGVDVKREAILDVYEIYEDCLADLCGQRKKRMNALKQKIISSKGKY